MRFAFWITKATNTYSEYAIFITFPQQWLHEGTSVLRNIRKFVACRGHATLYTCAFIIFR